MSSMALASANTVLADRIPKTRTRDMLLVAGGAVLTAGAAQISFPLPFTPVPISGQTFSVLLVAAALGPRRGSASMGLYVLLGLVGLPFYADGASGPTVLFGATGGYLVGFIVASVLVGWLASKRFDRTMSGAFFAYVAGSSVIYVFGVLWLSSALGIPLVGGIQLGLLPFLVGDAIKALLAAALLPTAWRLVGDRSAGEER
jgi:biotin transport system substrate-specific component